jgi:GNAT superfamily N-acetyltransferase
VNISYREAGAEDVLEMAACRADDPHAGPADSRMAAYFQGAHHPHKALLPRTGFVAIQDGKVIGYIAGHLTRRLGCEGEVQYLYVNPHYRRIRLASGLLHRLADWFVEKNAFKVCVNVVPDSPVAASFYARYGAVPLNKHWSIWEDIREVCSSKQAEAALFRRANGGLHNL